MKVLVGIWIVLTFVVAAMAIDLPTFQACPPPVAENWPADLYYNPQSIVVWSGTVTAIKPCYATVKFTNGTITDLLMGEMASLIKVSSSVIVEYKPSTGAVGYVGIDGAIFIPSPTPTPSPTVTPTPTPTPTATPTPSPTATPTPTPSPSPSPSPSPTPSKPSVPFEYHRWPMPSAVADQDALMTTIGSLGYGICFQRGNYYFCSRPLPLPVTVTYAWTRQTWPTFGDQMSFLDSLAAQGFGSCFPQNQGNGNNTILRCAKRQ